MKIPANSYKGQTAEVPSAAVNAVLIAGTQLKEDMVYNLTKTLFENQPELASAHAKGKELNLQNAVKGVSIPLDPGAVKYYKEKGLMKEKAAYAAFYMRGVFVGKIRTLRPFR